MPLIRAKHVGVRLEGVDVPSGTTLQRGSGNIGTLRFNTTDGRAEIYTGSDWALVGGGATGGGADEVFIENDQVVTTDYTISANKNAVSAGNITVNGGVTVTVPSGSRWVVV